MEKIRDSILVRRVVRRDETALLKIIEIYTPLIKSIVKSKMYFLQEDVEEVINDIFLKIWDNIEQFDSKKGSFRNWICGIANFQTIDKLRRIYDKETLLPLNEKIVAADYCPEKDILYNELIIQLESLLDNLKEEDKNIFLDLFFQGYSYEEVSEKYGIRISNLYNRVSRGRKVLKEVLEEGEK